jgi:hypothetical protein
MTGHKEWFSYLEKPKNPREVSTGDDTPHPIANVGEVPLSCVGMEVRFTHLSAFIEKEGRIIARGCRDGRMFILDRTDDGPDTALFAKGQKAESDIDLWHKRIGHVNYRRLQDL